MCVEVDLEKSMTREVHGASSNMGNCHMGVSREIIVVGKQVRMVFRNPRRPSFRARIPPLVSGGKDSARALGRVLGKPSAKNKLSNTLRCITGVCCNGVEKGPGFRRTTVALGFTAVSVSVSASASVSSSAHRVLGTENVVVAKTGSLGSSTVMVNLWSSTNRVVI